MAEARRQLVLLAEDDPDQAEILEEILSFEGYRVLRAASSEQVLHHLEAGPDAVLLDVCGVTNVAVQEALRLRPDGPAVLLVSGDHHLPAIARFLGADAFLMKPYDVEELLSELRQALRSRRRVRLTAAVSPLESALASVGSA